MINSCLLVLEGEREANNNNALFFFLLIHYEILIYRKQMK